MSNQQIRALTRTVAVLGVCLIAPFLVMALFTYVDLKMLAYLGIAVTLGFMAHLVYSINLNQIKYEDNLKETAKSFKE